MSKPDPLPDLCRARVEDLGPGEDFEGKFNGTSIHQQPVTKGGVWQRLIHSVRKILHATVSYTHLTLPTKLEV